MKYTEILAPCGSGEALEAALRSGADAVYLGSRSFNARRNAQNFSDEALQEAIRHCHERGVKAYVTLNTLVRDAEIPAALQMVERVCAMGADALILQDTGLCRRIREAAPGLALHASTQMSVHTRAGLRALRAMGFCRVVLARELSLAEIRDLAQDAPLELEMFVHGALCMSVSGQCTLSAMLGGRSGNRGLCAQPCRLPFAAPEGTGHDLSLKDLSLLEYLPALAALGIASFKIEGRMKRPEYVAAAVSACKAVLDGEPLQARQETLRAVFARSGFTAGYYEDQRGRDMFGVRTREDVTAAPAVLAGLQQAIAKEAPRYPVQLTLTARVGDRLHLTARADGQTLTVAGDDPLAEAREGAAARERVEAQLRKCGGTLFWAESVDCNLDGRAHIPLSEVNRVRREALAGLLQKIAERPRPLFRDIPWAPAPPEHRVPPERYLRLQRLEQMPGDLSGIGGIYLPLEATLPALTEGRWQGVPVGVELPRGLFGREAAIRQQLEAANAKGCRVALTGNLGGILLAREAGMRVHGDFGLNVMNTAALEALQAAGVERSIVSFENTLAQIGKMGNPIPKGVLVYGRLPLMLTRNCPIRNGRRCSDCRPEHRFLTDRKGERFPVVCRQGCSEVLNAHVLDLAGRMEDVRADYRLYYFTTESRSQCESVLARHQAGQAPAPGYTRGLYYRGVE